MDARSNDAPDTAACASSETFPSVRAGASGISRGVPFTIRKAGVDTNSSHHERARSARVSRRHLQTTTKSLRGGLGAFHRRKRWFNNSRNICSHARGASQIITTPLSLICPYRIRGLTFLAHAKGRRIDRHQRPPAWRSWRNVHTNTTCSRTRSLTPYLGVSGRDSW